MEGLPHSPYFLATVLLFVLAEAAWRVFVARRGYDAGAAAASFGVAAGNFILKPLTSAVIVAALFAVRDFSPLRLPLDDWRIWLLGFVAVEFVYYWFHRWSHTIRWLWASHAAHHSAQEMTLPAAIRLGWTNLVSGGWLLFAPLVALGFHPLMIAALLGGNLVYQFFLHTEAVGKLGPLEWVLNTPAHHRVHHACNPEFLDKNFGGVVIVFDRVFGTFAAQPADAVLRYGLSHGLNSKNPFVIALHEWARMFKDVWAAHSLRDLASATFGRPR